MKGIVVLGAFYRYDTPLTVAHETPALLAAGFRSVETLGSWEATYTLKAEKKGTSRSTEEQTHHRSDGAFFSRIGTGSGE